LKKFVVFRVKNHVSNKAGILESNTIRSDSAVME
jgi:hypothetical protein